MRLELFNQIDKTLALYEKNHSVYLEVEKILDKYFTNLCTDENNELLVGINSRVKKSNSLKEKIIRSKIYLEHASGMDILSSMSDLVGLTLECRFIFDEQQLMEVLYEKFSETHDNIYFYCKDNPKILLNLAMIQPQKQKNGHDLYRIDGIIYHKGYSVRFELQIKALVHLFWSNIEHKLVYKNTNYFVYNDFMQEILHSILNNLVSIDQQLSIVYKQMQNVNVNDTSLNEVNFEKFITKALNDLFALKMQESIGFTINMKDMATVLSHYVFFKELKYTNSSDRFSVLFEIFKRLNNATIDFESAIAFEDNILIEDAFEQIMHDYLIKEINTNYDWHVFFKMLFFIEPGDNSQDFSLFLKVLKSYLYDNYWFKTSFARFDFEEQNAIHNELLEFLALNLVNQSCITIIYTQNLDNINVYFRRFVNGLEQSCNTYQEYQDSKLAHFTKFKQAVETLF